MYCPTGFVFFRTSSKINESSSLAPPWLPKTLCMFVTSISTWESTGLPVFNGTQLFSSTKWATNGYCFQSNRSNDPWRHQQVSVHTNFLPLQPVDNWGIRTKSLTAVRSKSLLLGVCYSPPDCGGRKKQENFLPYELKWLFPIIVIIAFFLTTILQLVKRANGSKNIE